MSEPVQPMPGETTPAPKLLASPGVKLRLVGISLAVLVAGAFLAPPRTPAVLSVAEERVMPLLEEQFQRRQPVTRTVQTIPEVVAAAFTYGVVIPSADPPAARTVRDGGAARAAQPPSPAGFGVFTSTQDVLTHADALNGRRTIRVLTAGGREADATVVAYEPSTGLALIRTASEAGTAAPIRDEPAAAGAFVVAAAPWGGQPSGIPAFVVRAAAGTYTLAGANGPLAPGSPLFDLNGELTGIVGGPDTPPLAFHASDAVARLTARADAGRGHPGALGLSLQPLDGALAEALGATGVLVSDVVPGSPAASAGIRTGDVLAAIGGTRVESVNAARRAIDALVPDTPVTLQVMRAGAPQTIEASAGAAFDIDPLRGRAADPPLAPQAGALFPPEQLDAAGVPPEARVIGVNGRPVATRAQAAAEMRRRTGPAVVYLVHQGERFFVAVPRS